MILGAIIGGAIGNTIDRMYYGYVIDFIDVDMPDWIMPRWHVFNIADAAVSVSVVLLAVMFLLGNRFAATPGKSGIEDPELPADDTPDSLMSPKQDDI